MARRATRLLDPDLPVVFGGVDCAAVRAFLVQAHEAITTTQQEVDRLRETHGEVMTELVAAQEQEREATRTLSRAEQDARQIREAGQRNALRLVTAAEERAATLVHDAERELMKLAGSLERWHERRLRLADVLQAELDDLAAFAPTATDRLDVRAAPPSTARSSLDADPALPGDLAYDAAPEPEPARDPDALDPMAWAPAVSVVPDPQDWIPQPVPLSQPDETPAMPSPSLELTPPPDEAEPKPMDWSLPIEPLPLGEPLTTASPQPAAPAATPRRAAPVAVSSKPRPLIRRLLGPASFAAAAAVIVSVAVMAWPRLSGDRPVQAPADKPAKSAARKSSAAAASSQKTTRKSERPAENLTIPPGGMLLAIHATSPCWIKLTIGERIETRLLTPGETLTRQSRGDVLLRAGNAAALEVSVNGLALPPLGPEGAVVTKRISPPIDGSPGR
jgi:hypothetical protein